MEKEKERGRRGTETESSSLLFLAQQMRAAGHSLGAYSTCVGAWVDAANRGRASVRRARESAGKRGGLSKAEVPRSRVRAKLYS